MNPWWKISLIGAYTLLIASTAWHTHTIFDQAQQAKELVEEIAAHQKDQKTANAHATTLEQELAGLRQKETQAQQRENTHEKPAIHCPLSPDRLSAIHDAIAANHPR